MVGNGQEDVFKSKISPPVPLLEVPVKDSSTWKILSQSSAVRAGKGISLEPRLWDRGETEAEKER